MVLLRRWEGGIQLDHIISDPLYSNHQGFYFIQSFGHSLMWPSSLLHTPMDMFICWLSIVTYQLCITCMAAYLYPPYVLLWEKMPGKTMQKLMADTMGPHLQVLPNDAQLPKLQQWQFLGDGGISQRPGPNERCNISNGCNPTMMMMMMKLNRIFCLSVASGWTVLKDINSLALEFGWLCFPLILCTRVNSNCYR